MIPRWRLDEVGISYQVLEELDLADVARRIRAVQTS
ncbi:hypothetical protein HNQ08_004864 [Deinococcus humi]|uniref:Uncharacterized protein n=1 Tax=Deinococcus humi TaxID=662880 RepID=A0A7W8JZJ8_9DEIO|nr:hypothetical protein [Deinococcus humi]